MDHILPVLPGIEVSVMEVLVPFVELCETQSVAPTPSVVVFGKTVDVLSRCDV